MNQDNLDADLPAAEHDLSQPATSREQLRQQQAQLQQQAQVQQTKVEPKAPAHSQFAVQTARAFNLTDEQINRLTPAELDNVLLSISQAGVRPPQPEAEAKDEWADFDWGELEQEDPEVPGKKVKVKLTEDQYAKPVAQNIRKTRELEKSLQSIQARMEAREKAEHFESVDDAFSSLGEQFIQFFGEGTLTDLAGTEQAELRRRFYKMANVTLEDTPRQVKAKIAKAVKQIYGPMFKGAEPEEEQANGYIPQNRLPPKNPVNGRFMKPADYEAQALASPANRTGGEAMTRAQMAAEAQAAAQRKAGLPMKGRVPDYDADLRAPDYDMRFGRG